MGRMRPRVQFRRMRPDAIVPRYMTAGAAGLDLCAAIDAPVAIEPGARVAISTGLALAIPDGHEGQVRPRSGLAREHGITVVNAPGTIDSDYRGEVHVPLINLGPKAFTIERGMRIAQMLILPVPKVKMIEVKSLDKTARGERGFGHTGH